MNAFLLVLFLLLYTFSSRSINSMNLSNDSTYISRTADSLKADIEIFPIAVYDTDIGFGYGVKLFLLNNISIKESIDITFFRSTKGEQWYRLVISLPDAEYKLNKDVIFYSQFLADYDKWKSSNFFGIGSNSQKEKRELYTKEPFLMQLELGCRFLGNYHIESGIKYETVQLSNISRSGELQYLSKEDRQSAVMFFINIGFETINRHLNPSNGISLKAEFEKPVNGKLNFLRNNFTCCGYHNIDFLNSILAARLQIHCLYGNSIPFSYLSSLGGNNTLRGFPQDRFIDKSFILLNSELRFPIIMRFGGVAGIDCGQVFDKFSGLKPKDFSLNTCLGLRYYLDTFNVRLDAGFSNEYTGIYFNFNHIF